MPNSEHKQSFAGLPIREAADHPEVDPAFAYRVDLDWDSHDEGLSFTQVFDAFMQREGVAKLRGLVVGNWSHEMGDDVELVRDSLTTHRAQLSELSTIFLGDVTCEEQECSWIQQADITEILALFPELKALGARGSEGLEWSVCEHPKLEVLVIESGGLDPRFIAALSQSTLPKLKHLELWLGEENYGGAEDADAVLPLLTAIAEAKFPALESLGLRNAEHADALAAILAQASLPATVKTLDISMGTLSDAGARSLATAAPSWATSVEQLLVQENYISSAGLSELREAGFNLGEYVEQREDDGDGDRYVSLGE